MERPKNIDSIKEYCKENPDYHKISAQVVLKYIEYIEYLEEEDRLQKEWEWERYVSD